MAKDKGYWVKKVTGKMKEKGTEGALTDQAKRAGMSLDQFCAQEDLDTTTQRRCNFFKATKSFSHKK